MRLFLLLLLMVSTVFVFGNVLPTSHENDVGIVYQLDDNNAVLSNVVVNPIAKTYCEGIMVDVFSTRYIDRIYSITNLS